MFDLSAAPETVPLQQSPEFAGALEVAGTPGLRLDDGTLVLRRTFGPLPLRMISRPRTRDPEATGRLLRALPGRGPVVVAPEHPMDLGRIGALPLVSPASIAELDLAPPEPALLAGLHQKWRNRLRHGQKQGLRIARQNLPDDAGHWLFRADLEKQRQRRYRAWPVPLTLAYARANPGGAKLFTAFAGREPVAAILVLRHGAAASYHIGHTTAAGQAANAHNVLLWEAALWAKSKGAILFDLGTVDTEDHPGLARFKLGTGASVRCLGGTWLCWRPFSAALRPLGRLDRRLMRLG